MINKKQAILMIAMILSASATYALEMSGNQSVKFKSNKIINNGLINLEDNSTTLGGVHSLNAGMVNVHTGINTLQSKVEFKQNKLINNGEIKAVSTATVIGGLHRACAGMVNVNC